MRLLLTALLALALAPFLATMALAHHGWSWTTGKNVQVEGVIVEADLGMPHGVLVLDVAGETWTVEVGQPWRNERAGIAPDALAPGVEVRIEGEPAADISERRVKAERLWLGETLHELYPERN